MEMEECKSQLKELSEIKEKLERKIADWKELKVQLYNIIHNIVYIEKM